MKNCYKCGERQPKENFHKNKAQYDGLSGRCKSCEKLRLKRRRETTPDIFRRKDARYYDKHKEAIAARRGEWRKKNFRKTLAHDAVRKALKAGVLKISEECEKCGVKTKTDAHHDDYDKPLDILWLCRKCHMQRHRE